MIDSCVYVWGGCVSDRQRKAEDAVVPRISSGGLAPRVVVIAAVVIVVVVVFNPPDVSLDEETASVAPHEEDRGEPRAVVLGPVRGRVVRKAMCNAQRWDVNRVAELSTVSRFRIRLQTAKEKKERKVRVGRCYRKYCERDVSCVNGMNGIGCLSWRWGPNVRPVMMVISVEQTSERLERG